MAAANRRRTTGEMIANSTIDWPRLRRAARRLRPASERERKWPSGSRMEITRSTGLRDVIAPRRAPIVLAESVRGSRPRWFSVRCGTGTNGGPERRPTNRPGCYARVVIVVVGSPSARLGATGVRAAGLPAAIAREIAAAGAVVQLVGKLGEGPDGDAVALSLAADGIGHVALQRIAAQVAVGAGLGGDDGPLDELAGLGTTDDAADV